MVACWDQCFIQEEMPSIEFLELFALVAAILAWGHLPELSNTRVKVFCDNQTVKSQVNNLTAGCRQCLKLIRILALNNLKYNRQVFVEYVKRKIMELQTVCQDWIGNISEN